MLLVSRCDGSVMFDFAEEPLDCIAQFVEFCTEGRMANPIGPGLDVGVGAALPQRLAQGVGVIGAVGKQDIAGARLANMSAARRPSLAWPGVILSRIGRARFSQDRLDQGLIPESNTASLQR